MFEFDPDKSAANLAKHGIDFETAQALWSDSRKVFGPTLSPSEERWMLVAKLDEKVWSAIYTWRGETIRLISVRRSREDEAWQYEHQDD
jgi:uncharacterized DUF497 family protein